MSKVQTYEQIREIIGSDRNATFFIRDEMEKILEMTGHLPHKMGSPYKTNVLFEKHIASWIPQKTTDAHPVELNLHQLLKLLKSENLVDDFIRSLKDTDLSRRIKEISIENKNTITIKLHGGEK